MALSLKKGSKVNLAIESPKMKVAGIGLGWKPNTTPNGPIFDLDVSAFLIQEDGLIPDDTYAVCFGSSLFITQEGDFIDFTREINEGEAYDKPPNSRPVSGDQSVRGAVDSREGDESEGGDDEDMIIYFDKIWEGITQIVITVSINKDDPDDPNADLRTHALHFGMVNDCYIRAWDYDSNNEIFRYDLQESFSKLDAVEFGRFYRVGNSWEFVASGLGYRGGFEVLVEQFRRPEPS